MRKCLSITLAAFLLAAVTASLNADLKDYIFIVKPVYHQKTRALFLDLAQYFGQKGNASAQAYFSSMAGEYAHGTGWVIVDTDGQNYIITNRHVVIGAEKVNVYLESVEGAKTAYSDCPILYVDTQMDLAVIQFPGAQKLYKTGFRLETRPAKDLTEVVAAGYPGFGGEPLWQVSLGNITNSQARIDPAYAYLIQHSAPIDPGNSGGPLLVRDASTPIGFSVVGVNTLKALKRESTNFAIPTRHVSEVLEKAKRAKKLAASPAGLRSDLVKSATELVGELNSDNPVDQNVNRHISYAIVGEMGWDAYQGVLQSVEDQQKFTQWFLDDPVEAMRTSIYWFFASEVSPKKGSAIEFKGINPADEDAIGIKNSIRTTFEIGGKSKEIVWSLEYGQWKISNMSLDFPQAAAATSPARAPAQDPAGNPPQPATSGQAAAGAEYTYDIHSLVGGTGIPGPYLSVAYTGMIFSGPVGISVALGYVLDGSLFLVGGPAFRLDAGLLLPLRAGLALSPLGTTLILVPGILFKFSDLALGIDVGYAFPDSFVFGASLGFSFPAPPAGSGY